MFFCQQIETKKTSNQVAQYSPTKTIIKQSPFIFIRTIITSEAFTKNLSPQSLPWRRIAALRSGIIHFFMGTPRILSGMRPTGKLHLGHYTGALENWVVQQNLTNPDGTRGCETCFLIADYHNLTTSLDTREIYQNTIEMLIDWLAAGVDPEKSPVFRQSQIKEHTELFLIFSMLITSSRLERNPTLKEQVRDLNMDSLTYGHLGYPVLQAADILLYKGTLVPVGEDRFLMLKSPGRLHESSTATTRTHRADRSLLSPNQKSRNSPDW